jgi:hypothetical protein
VFLIFRRPDLTAQVFETIRQAQPTKLLIVADGPRNEEESVLCQQARAITENIDWNCEVLRNYSDVNLGCRNRVSSGLTWAFRQVEEAIILEDDCLPHPSFFSYCESLLEYYRNDEQVMVISGNNFQEKGGRTLYSYYFSKYSFCWGWASWRRAWQHWEFNPQKWIEFRDKNLIQTFCPNTHEEKYWTSIFNTVFLEGKPDTWAYVWLFTCWAYNGLTILPRTNLVSNIGFGPNSTNTGGKSHLSNISIEDIGHINHPPLMIKNSEADRQDFEKLFKRKTVIEIYLILRKIKAKFFKNLSIVSLSKKSPP